MNTYLTIGMVVLLCDITVNMSKPDTDWTNTPNPDSNEYKIGLLFDVLFVVIFWPIYMISVILVSLLDIEDNDDDIQK